MKIYLARHGETLFNKLKLSQGWCDSPLTEYGITQGKNLGKILKDVKFAGAYTSTSERAIDTLQFVMDENLNPIDIHETKLLKEVNFGILEAMPDPMRMSLLRTDQNNFSFMFELKQGYKEYNGESYEEICSRVKQILDLVTSNYNDDDQVILMSHGGYLRTLMALTIDSKNGETINVVPNAGCIVLDYCNGEYTLSKIIENNVSRETL